MTDSPFFPQGSFLSSAPFTRKESLNQLVMLNEGSDVYANSKYDILRIIDSPINVNDGIPHTTYKIIDPTAPYADAVKLGFDGEWNLDEQALIIVLMDRLKQRDGQSPNRDRQEAIHHLCMALDFLNNIEED